MDRTQRWNAARAYALRQGCGQAEACEYADHADHRTRRGTPDATLFAAWVRANS